MPATKEGIVCQANFSPSLLSECRKLTYLRFCWPPLSSCIIGLILAGTECSYLAWSLLVVFWTCLLVWAGSTCTHRLETVAPLSPIDYSSLEDLPCVWLCSVNNSGIQKIISSCRFALRDGRVLDVWGGRTGRGQGEVWVDAGGTDLFFPCLSKYMSYTNSL